MLACATVAASPADAQPTPPTPPVRRGPLSQALPSDARRDYDAGKLLFEDGDYATALLMYRTAYDRTHDPRLLWNVAACQKNLRHYAKAAVLLRRYLAEGGDFLSAGDRRDAQELSKAIAPFTVPMTLHVDEPGAQVWVDDEPVGTSPLPEPVVLDMGTRRVRVKKDGFRLVERDVPVGGSAATSVEVVLQRESGRLELSAPAGAAVFVDEKEAGHGPRLVLDLPIGAHSLRVTAQRMRPLQRDVIVEDGRTRTLDLSLEAEAAPSAEVHVAVSCLSPDPLPQEGLGVFFDDATESALPLGVRMRREDDREVVAYVPFRVAPGRHALHLSASRCEASDVYINPAEGQVVDVKGELPPSNSWLEGTPVGSPDGWRVTAGLVESSLSFASYQGFFGSSTDAGTIGTTLVGPMVAGGLQGRWLSALVDARFQIARVTPPNQFGSTLSQWSVGVRPGVRIPLVIAAISAGIDLRLGQFYNTPDSLGSTQSGLYASAAFWTALDVQPFCEWGLQLGFAPSVDSYSAQASVNNSGVTSLWLHATYTPNGLCSRQHAGQMKIEATTH
jgi:hypothetical protein